VGQDPQNVLYVELAVLGGRRRRRD